MTTQPVLDISSVPSGPELGFAPAMRIQESFVASLERKTLLWLAERTPARINSDHLTILGFLGMLLGGFSYAWARWHRYGLLLAMGALAINWLGDSLDGTVARVRNKQRPRYGFYVDHVIDVLGSFAIMAGLAFLGYVTPMVAAALLASFLMFSAETFLATYTIGNFKLSYMKFGPTEIRVLLMIGNVFAVSRPIVHVFHQPFKFFDVGCGIAAVGMFVMMVMTAARN